MIVAKDRFKVKETSENPIAKIGEKTEEKPMSNDIEIKKFEDEIKALNDANLKMYEQWKQAGETITQQQNFQTQLVAQMNENNGAAKSTQKWMDAVKAKKVDK